MSTEQLPSYAVLLTIRNGARIIHLPTSERIIEVFDPCGGLARYGEAVQFAAEHSNGCEHAIVVDTTALWSYEPGAK
jgi:hypothetical protein